MNYGKQLRLFLPDGTPSGPRYYELVNWTGQAVVMPVSRIKELVSGVWPEFERPTPISPPSGPTQWLFQGPPAESKFLAAVKYGRRDPV